jgi:MFS family permease
MPGERDAGRGHSDPRVALTLICIIAAFNFGDRQLVAVLAEPIRAEFGLSDTELGLLTGPLFAVAYASFGLPVAWLADRTSRVHVLGLACAVWSVFTVICGLTSSFLHMALARIGVGIGEAGGAPTSHGLIAAFYPPHRRGMALAWQGYSGILGSAAGAALGAWIAADHGWRAAFLIIGAPGIVLAILLVLLVRAPNAEEAATTPNQRGFVAGCRIYFSSPALVHLTIAGCIASLLTYGLLNWLPSLLMREKGMTLDEVGTYFALASAGFMGVGLLGAGWLGDRLSARHPTIYTVIPAIALVVAVPAMVLGLLAPDWPTALILLTLTGGLVITHAPLALTLVQNSVPASQRAMASGIYSLTATLVGLGGGPLVIGAVSDAAGNLQSSLLALTPLFGLGALFYLLAARQIAGQGRLKPAALSPSPGSI